MKKNSYLLLILTLLVVAAIYLYRQNNKSSLAGDPLSEFAIQDTAKVNKIVITDHHGNVAKLERIPGNRLWKLNEKYFAREDAVNLLLKTFNRIRIRGNVSDSARDNMIKLIATAGKKVDIYMGEDEPAKIYYIGVPTPDHTGTVMLLEIPGVGRGEDPYITHMEEFTGFLTTRFFTNEMEWRYTGIFDYPKMEFKVVKVVNHIIPQQSFEVQYDGGDKIRFYDGYDADSGVFNHEELSFDTLEVKKLLLRFKKVHVETFSTMLSAAQADSIKSLPPTYTLSVIDHVGKTSNVDVYLRPAKKVVLDNEGVRIPYDMEYFWAVTDDGEIGLAQSFNFGPLLYPADSYLKKQLD